MEAAVAQRPALSAIPAEELAEYREIFNMVDRDGGGSISNEELGELMDTLGICATQEEIDLMIQEIDEDSNGEIDFGEFVAVMSRKVHAIYTPEQVKAAFCMFEERGRPGCIAPQVLEQVLRENCKDQLSAEQVKDLIRHLETDQNGLFHYVEYVRMMMS
jgi:calmodulin